MVKSKLDSSEFKWKDRESWIQDIWDFEHDVLLANIEQKFQHYVDEWVESEAGAAFTEKIAASRYKI